MPSEKMPYCFARLDIVFPLGPDGLRQVPPSCSACARVQACLKQAVNTPAGLEMRAERMAAMNHPTGSGVRGFFRRWSTLKAMHYQVGRQQDKDDNS